MHGSLLVAGLHLMSMYTIEKISKIESMARKRYKQSIGDEWALKST